MPMFSVCPLFFEGLVLFCYSTTTVYSFTQCIEAVGRTYVIFDIVVVVVLLLLLFCCCCFCFLFCFCFCLICVLFVVAVGFFFLFLLMFLLLLCFVSFWFFPAFTKQYRR